MTNTAKLNITIDLERLTELKLTLNEYAVGEYISRKQIDPESSLAGWCIVNKSEIAKSLRLTETTVFSILKKLLSKGLIERHEKTKFIRVSNLWYNTNYFSQTKDSLVGIKETSKEKESIKEREYINITSPTEKEGATKKSPSCPLNPKNIKTLLTDVGDVYKTLPQTDLQRIYPNGHKECFEHLTSVEEDRGEKFINRAKQFNALHKILRAGFDFDQIDKTVRLIEKKYGTGSWDYATVANWLEKGSAHA